MRVILLKNVIDIGREGEIKEVKDGFARNFLLPNHLAAKVTPQILQQAEIKKVKAAKDKEEMVKKYHEWVKKISGLEMHKKLKVGEKNEVFGSLHAKDIVAYLTKEGIAVDDSSVLLEKPIKSLGSHDVEIKFSPDIKVTLKVVIESDN